MRKEYAIYNLKEAKEHLVDIIRLLEESHNLEPLKNGFLRASFNEVYWHINKVWNCRNFPQKQIDDSDNDKYDKFCDFPKDLDI